MAEQIQCDHCGAILAPEDQFCGECGAPRPTLTQAPKPFEGSPVPAPPLPAPLLPPSPRPSGSPQAGWRTAFIILVVLAALTCLIGLISFVLFGSTGSESTTQQEDWLISALCCLLPIGGTGAVLAVGGAIIWSTRLKHRE